MLNNDSLKFNNCKKKIKSQMIKVSFPEGVRCSQPATTVFSKNEVTFFFKVGTVSKEIPFLFA